MSGSFRHVGMSYLKYADMCATHVRNCLKEPAKSKAEGVSKMHIRVTKWEDGKRLKPGALQRVRARGGRGAAQHLHSEHLRLRSFCPRVSQRSSRKTSLKQPRAEARVCEVAGR